MLINDVLDAADATADDAADNDVLVDGVLEVTDEFAVCGCDGVDAAKDTENVEVGNTGLPEEQ